jgi:hypothetical protein
VLETGFVLHRLPAWHANQRKRVVRAPKLHSFDAGLLCHLLGIREPEHLRVHPLRGAVFETWVVAEVYKALVHRGEPPMLFHYRETRGAEVDSLIERALGLAAVEMKSGATVGADFFAHLERFRASLADALPPRQVAPFVVYGGDAARDRSGRQAVPWRQVSSADYGLSSQGVKGSGWEGGAGSAAVGGCRRAHPRLRMLFLMHSSSSQSGRGWMRRPVYSRASKASPSGSAVVVAWR